jgi:hypothetical protein
MAGFAALIAPGSSPQDLKEDFQHFLGLIAHYKQLEVPLNTTGGNNCLAAKFDSPATIHPGIIHDNQTGSWLLAVGTVVSLVGNDAPAPLLENLLREFIDHGEKALASVDGSFALVIYDGQAECLSVFSDSYGLFGLFYGRRGNQVFISSSAFAVANQIQSQADILAVEHFLRAGRLEGDKTLWENVKRLLGGRVLHVKSGQIDVKEYWSPNYDKSISHLPMDEALERSEFLLSRTFSRLLHNEGKTWVDLTGGFDSRLVTMFISKLNLPFITYCMGPANATDVQISQKISQEMKWEYVHTQLPAQWCPDQFEIFNTALGCSDGRASLLRVSVTLRGFLERNKTIRTNVMGVGGENWRGLSWQIEKGNIGKTSNVNCDALLNNIFPSRYPIDIMRFDRTKAVRQELYDFIRELWIPYSEYPNSVKIDRFEMSRDSGHGGAYLSSVSGIQRSMAPLCFKEVVDFAFSLNYRWKLPRYHLFVRQLMERENHRLASLATTTGGPAYPIRIENFPRFWPLWKNMANRAVAIGSKKLLGKTVQIWPSTPEAGYPLTTWREVFHRYARSEGMLSFDTMYSAGLYKRNEFNALVEQDTPDPNHPSEFLDRVISVEMAMRGVGSPIE